MGSGKSTLGKRMAARAGWLFEDLDSRIEKAEGRSVDSIFSESGEDYFRNIEASELRKITDNKNIIIACGGGTPCFGDNMDFMNDKGTTIYIKHNTATLRQRIYNAKKLRPLVRGMDENELDAYIREKLSEREKWYNRAKIIVDGLKAEPGRLVDLITSQPPYNQG